MSCIFCTCTPFAAWATRRSGNNRCAIVCPRTANACSLQFALDITLHSTKRVGRRHLLHVWSVKPRKHVPPPGTPPKEPMAVAVHAHAGPAPGAPGDMQALTARSDVAPLLAPGGGPADPPSRGSPEPAERAAAATAGGPGEGGGADSASASGSGTAAWSGSGSRGFRKPVIQLPDAGDDADAEGGPASAQGSDRTSAASGSSGSTLALLHAVHPPGLHEGLSFGASIAALQPHSDVPCPPVSAACDLKRFRASVAIPGTKPCLFPWILCHER